ncbi:hypothetical protein FB451DRAFT_1234502, partial [Mycena latifolia]
RGALLRMGRAFRWLNVGPSSSPYRPARSPPIVRRLWVQWESSERQKSVESIDTFHTAPSLLNAGFFNEYRHLPLLPVHQLTRYEANGPWEMHQAILKLASNLVEARLTIDFDDEPWPKHSGIIDLLHLQRLYVTHTSLASSKRRSRSLPP